jgi:hypothetical protein
VPLDDDPESAASGSSRVWGRTRSGRGEEADHPVSLKYSSAAKAKLIVAAPERTLLFPGAPHLPEEVAVRPPAPFAGSAEFLRTPESTFTWTGDLAVTFPGLDPIRLTGPRFGVQICVLKGCAVSAARPQLSGS